MPIYKKVNKSFFKSWSYDMAYILGFFAADGYITVNKRGGQFWCIQIKDKRLLFSIRKKIGSNHKISERLFIKNKIYRLQIGSIEMCDDLRKLGFLERKTKNMTIPHVSDFYFNSFLRGYFDGDGNVWVGKIHKNNQNPKNTIQIMFTSCSLKFLKQLHLRLKQNGIQGGSIYIFKDKYARLSFSTHDALKIWDFMYNKEVDLSKGLFLQRKKKIFDHFIHLRS